MVLGYNVRPKKEGMQFAINFTILEVTRLSEGVKCISKN